MARNLTVIGCLASTERTAMATSIDNRTLVLVVGNVDSLHTRCGIVLQLQLMTEHPLPNPEEVNPGSDVSVAGEDVAQRMGSTVNKKRTKEVSVANNQSVS